MREQDKTHDLRKSEGRAVAEHERPRDGEDAHAAHHGHASSGAHGCALEERHVNGIYAAHGY